MDKLDMKYVAASALRINPNELSEVSRSVVLPPPSVNVMARAGFDLAGFDIDIDDGYRQAVLAFFEDESSDEYRQAFSPNSLYIHPCDCGNDPEALAVALKQHGLAVSLVYGTQYTGFVLTADRVDLSADLSSAYLLAGFVPPQELLLRGLEKNATGDLELMYQQAAAQAIDHFNEYVERVEQFVDPDFSSAMAP